MSEFAKRQLKKHGWTEGSGLGKQENGRCEPIKVSLKMDKSGVGHDPGKEFTDHWWLRVFNEAAQKIGKKQQDPASNEEDKSEQKKGAECKNNLYKNFVKSSTLTNGIEEKNGHSDASSEDSSDSEHDTSVPTLNDIHKFCGGATGHKAARFGIKMGGKLARIAQHDKMFEERLEKEKLTVDVSTPESCKNDSLPDSVVEESSLLNSGSESNKQIPCQTVDGNYKRKKKHKKHKKEKHSQNEEGGGLQETLTDGPGVTVNDELSETVTNTKKHKKKKHKENTYHVEDSNSELSKSSEKEHRAKSKKKRKHVSVDIECEVYENNVEEINKSHKKITEEVSSNEFNNESRSEKKRRLKNNIVSDTLDESMSKRKDISGDQMSSDVLLDESSSNKKNKKDGQKMRSKALLAESESNSKRKNTAGENTSSELLEESERKRKKKRN